MINRINTVSDMITLGTQEMNLEKKALGLKCPHAKMRNAQKLKRVRQQMKEISDSAADTINDIFGH